MTRKAAWSLIALVATGFVLIAANFLFTAQYVKHTQQAERAQGAAAERKLCTTLARVAALMPPPGNPSSNPSRAYEQHLHATLAQLGPDIGCTTH